MVVPPGMTANEGEPVRQDALRGEISDRVLRIPMIEERPTDTLGAALNSRVGELNVVARFSVLITA